MIYNEALFELEDQSDRLVEAVLHSSVYQQYIQAQKALAVSEEAQGLKAAFQSQQAAFEKIAAYGTYAPDYQATQKALFQAKRRLDLQADVAAFKVAETQLQQILDEITETIAATISTEIKVTKGNPFFETKSHHCKGNCHG